MVVLKMLPNELYTVSREEFEKLFSDPQNQLMILNTRIAFLKCEIGVMINELKSMEKRRRDLIKEILK